MTALASDSEVEIDIAIGQRLHPKSLGIDDLEQQVLRLHDLPGHDLHGGNDAVCRSAQNFEFGARVANGFAANAQALQLRFQVRDLALRHGAALGERTQAPKFYFGDRDQLLDLARLLRDGRAVGQREVRIDLRQSISLAHRLTDAWHAGRERGHTAAMHALHHAGPVRIADDAADQADGGPHRFRLCDRRLHLQEALCRFGDKGAAVRQAAAARHS